MDTQPAIMTYAPLITSVVIGLGIVVTLAIIGAKIIFNLAGLFKDVKTLTDMIKELRHPTLPKATRSCAMKSTTAPIG